MSLYFLTGRTGTKMPSHEIVLKIRQLRECASAYPTRLHASRTFVMDGGMSGLGLPSVSLVPLWTRPSCSLASLK